MKGRGGGREKHICLDEQMKGFIVRIDMRCDVG